MTLLSMLAIVFLPRQFQVAVIENVEEKHLKTAVWLFPLYMLAINVFVLPIAFGGMLLFPAAWTPTASCSRCRCRSTGGLALLVFVGGISAATGMVIVETIALSTMVCNDLVMPILLRWKRLNLAARGDLHALLLDIRRGAIVVILLLGYFYFAPRGEAYALVSIGLISFAAVAQFAPALSGRPLLEGRTRNGALAGLSLGFAVWFYTLLLPAFAKSGWFGMEVVEHGLLGIELLRPTQLFGLAGLDQITHAMIWSMVANIGAYVAGLAYRAAERRRAQPGDPLRRRLHADRRAPRLWRAHDLGLGAAGAPRALPRPGAGGRAVPRLRAVRGSSSVEELEADAELLNFAERQLAGTIGAASRATMVATVAQEEPLGMEEVMTIIDEASHVIAYSHELEQKKQRSSRRPPRA
jgi:Na+/proline symporter